MEPIIIKDKKLIMNIRQEAEANSMELNTYLHLMHHHTVNFPIIENKLKKLEAEILETNAELSQLRNSMKVEIDQSLKDINKQKNRAIS